MPKLSVIVPTYNERENVAPFYQRLAGALEDFELIFVDDNSPDGTAQAIGELQAQDGRVKLLRRPGKMGLGSAVLEGLGLAQGQVVAMMDADLSHDPGELPRLLEAMDRAEVVVGSRYAPGGRIVGWPLRRQVASRVALLLCRLWLHPPVRDATSGFALFQRQALEKVRDRLSPRGYKLLLEVLALAPQWRVAEVPITFMGRIRGKSKLDLGEVWEFLRLCWRLRWERRRLTIGPRLLK